MGIKEGALALADELEAFEDGDCEECIAYGQPECKGHLSCAEIIARYSARKVREAVERDAEDVATVSAYDLLSDDDREAIAWVREMGGVNALSRGFQDADNRRIELCSSLGIDLETGWADAMVAMRRRLMPEGMEWPTVDGKPVVIGERMRSCGIDDCKVVGIDPANSRLTLASDNIEEGKATYFTDFAEYCHRPMTKVLDADGAEIRVGDRLYDIDTGCGRTVRAVNDNGTVEFDGHENRGWFGRFLTHRAPVLAADGEPLKVGQTVWRDDGERLEVLYLRPDGLVDCCGEIERPERLTHERLVLDADGVLIKEGDTVYVAPFDDPLTVRGFAADGRVLMDYHSDDSFGYRPDDLTHAKPEPPDSWERIEDDCSISERQYYAQRIGHDVGLKDDEEVHVAVSLDLVRRCRALAERGEI